MKKFFLFLPFAAVLGLVALFFFGLKQNPYLIPSALINKKVPNLKAPLLFLKIKTLAIRSFLIMLLC